VFGSITGETSVDKFPAGVANHLKWYVYRLIDPRNGETFYVGKGNGDRVFQHANEAISKKRDEDSFDLKFQRIKEIHATGLEVAHVIHRHGITTEAIAYEVEAALIDAYPGLANQVAGHSSNDFGVRHVQEIVRDYLAEPFEVHEPLILISIAQSFDDAELSIYEAVRGCWKIDPKRARESKLVLAHRRGLVIGAFRPKGDWLPATHADFPRFAQDIPNRYGFVGEAADDETCRLYVHKRVPDKFRAKGASNPIRFVQPPPALHPR
jgi:hypothetical protein